jgi:hypothetical protein
MTFCNLCEKCFFFNEPLLDNLSSEAECLRRTYCGGDFSTCMIYVLALANGIHKVPGYVYPDDKKEALNFNQIEPREGLDVFSKVVYPDGTAGMVKASTVEGLIKTGEIIAFHCSEGWVDVRRQPKSTYTGENRRRTQPQRFFARF